VRHTFRPQAHQLEPREVPSFGTGGTAVTELEVANGSQQSVALQADGRVVTAGGGTVARFNADGSPDATFNGTGSRALTGWATAVAVQSDGKVVVAGTHNSDFYLERFLPNGTPDATFSGDGVVVTGFKKGAGELDRIRDIALQADGKIVAVGEINGLGQWGVARFTVNGSLDTTFSGDGWLTDAFDKQATNEWANAVAVQPDGRILVVGGARRNATLRDWVAVRYTPGGALDSSFGTGGKAWMDFGAEAGLTWTPETGYPGMALAPDGRVVLVGETSGDRLGVARLTTAGALDPTFAGNGLLLTVPTGWTSVAPNDDYNVAVQGDGRVVVTANTSEEGVGFETAVGRFNTDGTADNTFDGDGWKTFRFDPDGASDVNDVILQPDGKIVVVGSVWIDGLSLLALTRLNTDGTFDL
jgi:uncharacterized delta-60 repeat protein